VWNIVETLGKYRMVAELGRGGSAEVYLCIQTGPTGSGFSKLAVVKRLRADRVDEPEFAAMLVDEARITARVRHPNVVQTFEVGLDGDTPFIAMEYLDGLPLHQLGRRAQRQDVDVPFDVGVLIIADALAGLHHAHELVDYDGTPLQVVHRDVSPHNVFVTIDGAVKVVDFGIAKAAGRVVETQTGVVKGKVRYMSPEHAMGHAVDRRADIFSSAVILWELLVGVRFWRDRDEIAIAESLVRRTFDPSPRAVDPSVPEELDRICRKALAADVAERYATCADFRADLEAYLGNRVIAARRALVALVGQLFAEDRKKIRATVEQAMRSVDLTRTSERMVPVRREETSPEDSPSVGPFVVAEPTELAPTLVMGAPREEATRTIIDPTFLGRVFPRKRFRAGALCGAAGAAVVAAAACALVVWTPGRDAHAFAAQPTSATTVHAAFASQLLARAPLPAPPAVTASATASAKPAPVSAPRPPQPTPRRNAGAKHGPAAPTAAATQGSLHLDTADPWGSRH
jgi:tRNA A-37 threonylcarbamoyl transferase component Bud32